MNNRPRSRVFNKGEGWSLSTCDSLRCCNHAINLTILDALHAVDLQVVADMYMTVQFLRMGGHFLRLAAAVRQVVGTLSRLRSGRWFALSAARGLRLDCV